MSHAWWQGSLVGAWSRSIIRRLRAGAVESRTVRRLRAWRRQWGAVGRSRRIILFTRGCLLGFVVVTFLRRGSLTLRELVIRVLVLLGMWAVARWWLRELPCAESADK